MKNGWDRPLGYYTTNTEIKGAMEDKLGEFIPESKWVMMCDIFWWNGVHPPVDDNDIEEFYLPKIRVIMRLGSRTTKGRE